MKNAILTAVGLLLLAGCALSQEAPYTDPQFGRETQQTLDRQIANTTAVSTVPEGMAGIQAEKVMNTMQKSYDVKRKQTNVMQIGLTGGSVKK